MKILGDFLHYKDGGTIAVRTDKGNIFVDGQYQSPTRGEVFLGDPNDRNATHVSNEFREEFLETIRNLDDKATKEKFRKLIINF